jgi:L-asparagine oxygenase
VKDNFRVMPESVDTFRELTVSDQSRDELGAGLTECKFPVEDLDLYLTTLRQAFAKLPPDVLREIGCFGRHVAAPGALRLRNLPTDPVLPLTPADGGPSPEKRTAVSEGVVLGLCELIGLPFALHTEKEGSLVHDVVPVAAGAATQTNQGSKVFLTFHNDIVFDAEGTYDRANPDFIILFCLRQDRGGEAVTYYADARTAVQQLPEAVLSTLRQPLFRQNAPGSYVRNFAAGEKVLSDPVALIAGPLNAPEIRLAANGVEPLGSAAAEALETLRDACRSVAHQVRLAPGDALLLNNRKGVHARSAFSAHHDGSDRWLQRCYVRHELWSIRERADLRDPWLH